LSCSVIILIHHPKSHCLWDHDPASLPAECKEAIANAGAKLEVEGWVKVLGAPVGVNAPAMRAAALSIAESHDALMQRLLSRNLSGIEESITRFY
jgi:hypothetical protein